MAVPKIWKITLAPKASSRLRHVVARMFNLRRSTGYNVIFTRNESGAPQGYTLSINKKRTEISYRDDQGAWNALQTFQQLCSQPNQKLPFCEIRDTPAIGIRGVMLDISRCKVPTQETLYQLVDLLASFKINQIQLYTEHTFAYAGHEVVWGDSSPMTAAQIRALDEYCQERFVELVPNQNCFGHFERWLRHPEYHHLAECPDGFEFRWGGRCSWGTTLKPETQSLAFVDGLMKDLLPNFTSKHFNVGCDETWDLGLGASRERCEAEGKHHVYLKFLQEIFKLALENGRKPQFWADIILESPELVAELPKEVTGLIWGYEASHPFAKQCARFAKTKVPFYVCPGTSTWNTIGGRLDNALGNLQSAAREGAKHGAAGYLITDWGDGGHHQQFILSHPGFISGAALAWNPKGFSEDLLRQALSCFVYQDLTGNMAETLLSLGRIPNLFEQQLVNRTSLNNMLFAATEEEVEAAIKLFEVDELTAAMESLDKLYITLATSTPVCTGHTQLRDELSITIGLLRHAASRARYYIQGRTDCRSELRQELTFLIGRFESSWIARNRAGGLHESSERLRWVLKNL